MGECIIFRAVTLLNSRSGWLKNPNEVVPHGIAYSFTFHEPDGIRLLGFDNAHPVPHTGGRYVKPKVEADHWHRTKNDEGRPYAFVSPAQLWEDFFTEVEKICEAQNISTEVVDDKEI